jgi:thiol-disulfide isomerase/thioredoxin
MVQQSSDSDFDEIINKSPKVVVKYYADWCGTCKLFAPKFRRLSEDARFEGVLFVEINAEENPLARKKANVNNLPFIATFENGKLKEGYATGKEDAVVEMISKLNQN